MNIPQSHRDECCDKCTWIHIPNVCRNASCSCHTKRTTESWQDEFYGLVDFAAEDLNWRDSDKNLVRTWAAFITEKLHEAREEAYKSGILEGRDQVLGEASMQINTACKKAYQRGVEEERGRALKIVDRLLSLKADEYNRESTLLACVTLVNCRNEILKALTNPTSDK